MAVRKSTRGTNSRNTSGNAHRRSSAVSRAAVETLEKRQLLTAIAAGDVVEWIDAAGATQRLRFDGSGVIEMTSVTFDEGNNPIVGNISLTIIERDGQPVEIDLFGGRGGSDGVEPIDAIFQLPNGGTFQIAQDAEILINGAPIQTQSYGPGDDDNNHVRALAANARGAIYGFNVAETEDPIDPANTIREAVLYNFDYRGTSDANAVVDLAPLIANGPGEPTNNVVDIVTADFGPTDSNKLYFVAQVTESFLDDPNDPDSTRTEADFFILYMYNLGDATLSRLGRIRTSSVVTAEEQIPEVVGMTFTQDGQCLLYVNSEGVNGLPARSGVVRLLVQDVGEAFPGEPRTLFNRNRIDQLFVPTDDGMLEELEGITNIEVADRDVNFLYATTDDDDIYHVNLETGIAQNSGTLVDPDDDPALPGNDDVQRGEEIGALTWLSTLRNPFLQEDGTTANDARKGVFIAVDTATDELVVIIESARSATNNLFNLYVTGTDSNSFITTATVPAFDPDDPEPRAMMPFDGDAGTIRVADDGEDETPDAASLPFTPDDGTGASFLGARTLDIDDDEDEQDVAIRRVKRPGSAGLDVLPVSKFIYAGLTVTGDLGRFYFGGTITGKVSIQGNVDQFYAGNILTGLPSGRRYGLSSANGTILVNSNETFDQVRRNFFIAGDLRNLAVAGTIGGLDDASQPDDMDFATGFDMFVGGRVGMVKAINGVIGAIKVGNDANIDVVGDPQNELEFFGGELSPGESYFEGNTFFSLVPTLGDTLLFSNDSFDSPQLLSTAYSQLLDTEESIVLLGRHSFAGSGNAANDGVDFYGLPLIAGQRVTVDLQVILGQFTIVGTANYGVFDPEGRLIATDYSNVDAATTLNEPFTFVADRPGVYRIGVSFAGDFNFNEVGDNSETISRTTPTIYQLIVSRGTADIAFGGVQTENFLGVDFFTNPISVLRGDLGAIQASGFLGFGQVDEGVFDDIIVGTVPDAIYVERGNLRSVEAGNMGLFADSSDLTDNFFYGSGAKFIVPRGVIGLIRTADDATVMSINDIDVLASNATTIRRYSAVDVQEISAEGATTDFVGNVFAKRSIGVIRVSNMDNRVAADPAIIPPPIIAANTDGQENDGVIDLIRVRGNMGSGFEGGPAISAGPGGNVRYIRVDGSVFRDVFFGNAGSAQRDIYDPGEVVTGIDDSGAGYTLTPVPLVTTTNTPPPVFGQPIPEEEEVVVVNPGQIILITYPIRSALAGGKAGDVIIDVTVRQPVAVLGTEDAVGRALQVDSSSSGGRGSVEIGRLGLFTEAAGTAWGLDYNGDIDNDGLRGPNDPTPGASPFIISNPERRTDILLQGSRPIDVFSVLTRADPRPAGGTDLTGLSSFANTTAGELVNLLARDVGDISAETVGLARSSTKTAVEDFMFDPSTDPVSVSPGATNANNVIANLFPFNRPRNMIIVRETGVDTPTIGVGTKGILQSVRSRRGMGNILVSGVIGSVAANVNGNTSGVFEGINGPIVCLGTTSTADLDDGQILSVNIGEGIMPSGTGNLGRAGIYAGDSLFALTNQGRGSDIRGDVIAGFAPSLNAPFTADRQITQRIFRIDLTNGAIINADIMVVEDASFANEYFQDNVTDDGFLPDEDESPTNPRSEIDQINLTGNGGIIGTQIAGADIGAIRIVGGFGFINSEINGLASDGVLNTMLIDGYGIRSAVIDGGNSIRDITVRGNGQRLSTLDYTSSVRQSENNLIDPFFNEAPNRLTDLHAFLGTTRQNPRRKGWSNAGIVADSTITGSRNLDNFNAFAVQNRIGSGLIPPTELGFPMRISFGQNVGMFKVRSSVDGLSMGAGTISTVSIDGDLLRTFVGVAGTTDVFAVGGNFKGSSSINATGAEGTINTLLVKKAMYGRVNSTLDIKMLRVGTDLGSQFLNASRMIGTAQIGRNVLSGSMLRGKSRIDNLVIGNDVQVDSVITSAAIRNQQIGGDVFGEIRIG